MAFFVYDKYGMIFYIFDGKSKCLINEIIISQLLTNLDLYQDTPNISESFEIGRCKRESA